jgi:hypothetical protein
LDKVLALLIVREAMLVRFTGPITLGNQGVVNNTEHKVHGAADDVGIVELRQHCLNCGDKIALLDQLGEILSGLPEFINSRGASKQTAMG